ncbi:MAG: zinc ABC transporter substrate-binding protein [Candidatus Staskawiczbacteria bacterium]|nr:zinc ABC transporter substrate-binding protein [Candidatus Staskawiczbacteria bacterium]
MNKKLKIVVSIIIVLVVISLLISAFTAKQKLAVQNNKLQVAASFYPLAFFSEQVGGDNVRVINIMPAGAEPHDYELTAQDIAQIENSKLLVLTGLGLEVWGNNIKQNLNSKNTVVLLTGEGIVSQTAIEGSKKAIDSHVWQSPVLAKKIVDKIVQGFAQVDPINKDYYQTNADALKNKLDSLDQDYKQGLSNCAGKNIITSHAAFGYLATAYGFNQVPIAGLSPDAEPSPQQLAEIVSFAKANNVKYIFFESLVSPKLSNTIATEVGAKTLVLNPLEGLTKEEIKKKKNYFTIMEKNLANLKIALSCK